MEWLEQQKTIAEKNTKLEKSKLLPDLSFAYNNMTIRGIGPDNVVYDGSARFQAGQIGIGIPLFYGAQKAKINASKDMQRLREDNYRFGLRQFNTEYQMAINQFARFSRSVDYFEETGLKNAAHIRDAAQQQFANGEINYLEWPCWSTNPFPSRPNTPMRSGTLTKALSNSTTTSTNSNNNMKPSFNHLSQNG